MIDRLVSPRKNSSFFLFGARGTGKTYFLERYLDPKHTLGINLLDPEEETTFALNPNELRSRLQRLNTQTQWVFIDEIQKVPKLLNLVHHLIEKTSLRFALTGSSARKLKRGGANLLAGRAFIYELFALTAQELGNEFDLDQALMWGTLPKIFSYSDSADKSQYLRAYANTYLKEEIAEEQIVRKLDPFRRFLQVAAQSSGQVLNFSKLARDVGVSTKTLQSYFQILEDTLLGRFVLPFHESVRKRQTGNPKFYFFDHGVKRALDRTLNVPLLPQTYEYGNAFEHFVVNEIHRLQVYHQLDYELSYLRTHDNAEIDLIIERPGLPRALIEIKSTEHIREQDLRHLISLGKDIPSQQSLCLSRDPHPKVIEGVACLPWRRALVELGLER